MNSLMHHVIKTIEGRRDIPRLTSALFGLMKCLVQQDLNRKYCLNNPLPYISQLLIYLQAVYHIFSNPNMDFPVIESAKNAVISY